MLKTLEGASGNAIAIEIIDGYMPEDEIAIEKLFEEKIAAGHTKVNILIKIDKLVFSHSSWKAMWDDGLYAMKHLKNCGRIAMVGHSKVEEFLIKADNVFFKKLAGGDSGEKYFDITDFDKALGWVNE